MNRRITPLAATALALALAMSPALAQSKKELVAKVLLLQQPSIEAMAKGMAEQPAIQLTMAARQAFGNVPADKREAVAKAIDADLKKYTDEAVPLLREKALKLAPATLGAELEKNFSEDELKQLIGWLESPVIKRFQTLAPGMQRDLAEKIVGETRGQIEPRLKTLEQSMAKQLGLPPVSAAPAPGSAAPAASPGAPAAPAAAAPAAPSGGAPMPGTRGADPAKK